MSGRGKQWHSLLVHGKVRLCRRTISKTHACDCIISTLTFILYVAFMLVRWIQGKKDNIVMHLPFNDWFLYELCLKNKRKNPPKINPPIKTHTLLRGSKAKRRAKRNVSARAAGVFWVDCLSCSWCGSAACVPQRSCGRIQRKGFPIWPLPLPLPIFTQ